MLSTIDWSQLASAVVVIIITVGAYYRSRDTKTTLADVQTTQNEIHVAVNSHLSAVVQDLAALALYISTNAKAGDPPIPQLKSTTTVLQPVVPENGPPKAG